MNNKNYFENIRTKAGFIAKYFKFFRLLTIIAYLFYLEMLVVDVFSAIEYVPGIDEVKAKFSPVAAKNEVIGSIERYFLDRENNLAENLQNEIVNNPFYPYKKTDDLNLVNINPDSGIAVPGNNVIN